LQIGAQFNLQSAIPVLEVIPMYPVVPADVLIGSWEMMCYVFTAAAALLSWLMTWR
jgi:hypothetical protein